MKKHKISSEVKEEILNRIKNDGVTISQISKEYGIPDSTIHSWISRKVEGQPTMSDLIKLKRENDQLKILLGEITLKLSETQKKK